MNYIFQGSCFINKDYCEVSDLSQATVYLKISLGLVNFLDSIISRWAIIYARRIITVVLEASNFGKCSAYKCNI